MRLGLEALGVWSLVLATTSFARFANLGAASGVGRFVAISAARAETGRPIRYVETALISNLVVFSLICAALWWPAQRGLALAVSGPELDLARGLLPYALLSFVLFNVSNVVDGAIIGQQKAAQKCQIVIAGFCIQLTLAITLIDEFGLYALAFAQITQYAIVLLIGWNVFLRNEVGRYCFRIPFRWSREIFLELLGFGVRVQTASIISYLREPATKFVMSAIAGLEALALFEMAQRVIQQFRQIVASPNQALMPTFAYFNEQDKEKVRNLYTQATAATSITGLPLMFCVALASPIISFLWMSRVDSLFVVFSFILAVGWLANLVSAPAHILAVATGRLRWNILGVLISTIGSPVLGMALGNYFGAIGVAAGAAFALGVGSLTSMVFNCRDRGLPAMPRRSDFVEAGRNLAKAAFGSNRSIL